MLGLVARVGLSALALTVNEVMSMLGLVARVGFSALTLAVNKAMLVGIGRLSAKTVAGLTVFGICLRHYEVAFALDKSNVIKIDITAKLTVEGKGDTVHAINCGKCGISVVYLKL